MKKAKRFFGGIPMPWTRVLLLAVLTGVVTGLLMCIRPLDGTSFQDIGVAFECWILFAVFLVTNCKKWTEAACKCFVFFLVSQPLVYLVQVPFQEMGWKLFTYYPYWFFLTLLTLPGGAIAWLVKRRDRLGAAVLTVAEVYLVCMGYSYARSAFYRPPYHLLSAVFCFALAVFFLLLFVDGKKMRIAVSAVLAASLLICAAVTAGQTVRTVTAELGAGAWECVEPCEAAKIEVSADGTVSFTAGRDGSGFVKFRSADGAEREYCVTVLNGGIYVNEME